MPRILLHTFREFSAHECPRMAAALAYYLFFALPAILATIVLIGGFFDRTAVKARLQSHFEETMGTEGATQIVRMLDQATQPKRDWRNWLAGTVMLLVGATGALGELQTALNRAWRVEVDPNQGRLQAVLGKRLLSLAMLVVGTGLVILSVAVSWALAAFGHWMDRHSSSWFSSHFMATLHFVGTLGLETLLFAALLRFVPDAEIKWRDVWLGALVTAILFALGQKALSLYLAWSQPTSVFGAAGSLAIVLLWIYYSALILLLGAEFTQVLARQQGKHVKPLPGARHEAPELERSART
jgi:membrane protein